LVEIWLNLWLNDRQSAVFLHPNYHTCTVSSNYHSHILTVSSADLYTASSISATLVSHVLLTMKLFIWLKSLSPVGSRVCSVVLYQTCRSHPKQAPQRATISVVFN